MVDCRPCQEAPLRARPLTDQQPKPPAWLYVRRDVAWHWAPPAFFSSKIKWTTHTTRRGATRPFDWRPPFVFCGELHAHPTHTKLLEEKCAWPISPQGAIQNESATRKPRRSEPTRSASAKPVVVNWRPPDYTARGGLHISRIHHTPHPRTAQETERFFS